MKIALVCDWLTTPGGAEKVLLQLHQMYPNAPIYTSQYSKKGIDWFQDADVRTGWLQIFPAFLRKIMGPLRAIYFHFLDLSDYDLVISVTGAEAKNIKTKKKPSKTNRLHSHHSTDCDKSQDKSSRELHSGAYHLCYCHVPTQYYWQFYDKYVADPGFGIFNFFVRFCFKLLVRPLRKLDFLAAQDVDQFLTISHYSATEIQKYYHRKAKVISPPVALDKFMLPKSATKVKREGYIISCRQVTWKRIDLAIKACIDLHLPLKVIGDGSEHDRLVKLADNSPYITFYRWLETADLAKHLQTSQAYIFPSLEPFGIAAVEALAAGCPVVAFSEGGSKDIVIPEENGVLFHEQTTRSLKIALDKFQNLKFNPKTVARSANKFSANVFEKQIKAEVAAIKQRLEHNSHHKESNE